MQPVTVYLSCTGEKRYVNMKLQTTKYKTKAMQISFSATSVSLYCTEPTGFYKVLWKLNIYSTKGFFFNGNTLKPDSNYRTNRDTVLLTVILSVNDNLQYVQHMQYTISHLDMPTCWSVYRQTYILTHTENKVSHKLNDKIWFVSVASKTAEKEILNLFINLVLWRCDGWGLVWFRHKSNLGRFKERWWFWLGQAEYFDKARGASSSWLQK